MLANTQHPITLGSIIIIMYYLVLGLILPFILTRLLKLPTEWMRKGHHFAHTTTIFLYLYLFDSWQVAIVTILLLTVLFYIALSFLERFSFFTNNIAQRKDGEFRKSLITGNISIALLIFIFWGVLGEDWKYVGIIGALIWAFGDAAAALVGKSIGRRKITHPWVDSKKTVEGTLAMVIVSGIVLLLSLMFYADLKWYETLLIALLVAPLSAIVELVSKKGSDTLTLPISAGLMTFAMISLLSI